MAILGLDSQKLATSIGHDRNWVYFLGLVEAAKDNIMNHKPNPILYHGTRKMNIPELGFPEERVFYSQGKGYFSHGNEIETTSSVFEEP